MPQPGRPIQLRPPPLHPGQQEVFDSTARFKVVCCGRRWGKTHLGVLMCVLVAAMGGRAWWIGPSYPVAGIGWRLLKQITAVIPGIEIRESDRMIVFPSGGVVQVKSADRPDSLRGESLDFVVFDEVADIKEEAWTESIRPALSSGHDYLNGYVPGGAVLFIGTPRGQGNWFYDIFRKAVEDGVRWAAFQQPTIRNTMIPALAEEIEEARQDMHPILFTQEFEAAFVVAGGTVFQDSWQRWYQLVGGQHIYDPEASLVMLHQEHVYETVALADCLRFGTSDLAISLKTTADYTVCAAWALTPKRNLCLLDFDRRRMEGPDIIPALHMMRQKWKLAYMGIEKVAFQATIIQDARRRGMPVRELKPDKDKVSRAMNAAAYMQGGKVWWRKTINDIPDFTNEVMNFPLAAHDDCTDVLAYATTHIDLAHFGPQLYSF